ncbi:MAG TPA: DUF6249 domain-containing protein [Caulobacteraceae bacterium]|nr:DUF6249 domain-containing protein [Caulobacteraceae bacterium]
MHDESIAILIPISMFAMIAAIVIVPNWLRSKERQKMQDTLRVAYEKGQPVPPEIIEAMTRDVKPAISPYRDIRRAVVLIAIALALGVVGVAHGQNEGYDEAWGWWAGASFPGFIGLGYLLIALFTRGKKLA